MPAASNAASRIDALRAVLALPHVVAVTVSRGLICFAEAVGRAVVDAAHRPTVRAYPSRIAHADSNPVSQPELISKGF
jgi:hypothetical protein